MEAAPAALAPEAPAIPRRAGRASRGERITLALLAVASLLVLGVARSLEPDARGFGTHERLGLPPCGLMRLAGVPCPSCGMTTAFAYAAHLEPLEALRAQPFGALLAALAAALALGGPVAVALAVPVFSRLTPLAGERLALGALAALLAAWAYKVVVVVWMR
jgi:hypothetical protein